MLRGGRSVPAAAGLLLAVLLGGCQPREPKRGYVARVGDTYLMREEIEAGEDSTLKTSDASIRQEVTGWVNNELLYEEARRQGLDNSEAVQKQVRESRKQLSIEAYLQKEIYGDSIYIPEDSIRTYYEKHPEEFHLREDLVQVNLVVFNDRRKANAFRAKMVGGTKWNDVLAAFQADTASQKTITTSSIAKYYTPLTFFPQELWRVSVNLLAGETSFPVRTQGAFVIIQTLARYRQGATAPLDFVRNEIRQRLIIERRRQRYGDLITRLRSQYEVEITVP